MCGISYLFILIQFIHDKLHLKNRTEQLSHCPRVSKVYILFFVLMLYVPANIFSVMLGLPGFNQTKY